MKRPEIVAKIRLIIKNVAPDADIILYGSEARGDALADSDFDLLILVNKEKLSYQDITTITFPLYDLELSERITISPLIYSKEQWLKRPFKTPFYINITNEGIIL